MTNDDVCYLSATAAVKLFKSRKLSPVELLAALIARTEKLNPPVNCFADRYFDEALAAARQSEARYMKRGARLKPLEGVPLAVKDAQRVAGKRTTHGSLIFKDNIDGHSDPMIERLQKAGAIIFMPPRRNSARRVSRARAWGNTVNPWNTLRPAVLRRLGRRLAARASPPCYRHRYRRLDPHSFLGLRHRRLQTAPRPQSGRPARKF
jgi:Asp-tRNA(Asn)/Glu-tRNA(Gln) amidotransferase A subunit family amidase